MKTAWKVLVTNAVSGATRAGLERFAEVSIAPDSKPETLRQSAGDADLIIVRAPLPADIFSHARRVLGVVRHGVGLDFIPVDSATENGILVANVPGANANSVAEFCVMQMLNLLRNPARAERLIRHSGWAKARAASPQGADLSGRMVGIIGFGAIGSRLAHILHFGFQAKVAVCTRQPDSLPDWASHMELGALVSEADFVVPCVPLTKDTRHLLNADLIGRMKPTAYVVNASRGGVIEEAALIRALNESRIAGAALDVYEDADPQPGDAVMCVDNALITPHLAGNTLDAHARIGEQCVLEALQILRGERPQNLVNPGAWERHLARRKELGSDSN